MERRRPQHRQRVDLLRDFHRGQFRGHGAADAAGEHSGREHRPKFAHDRDVDHRAQSRRQAHLMKDVIDLDGHHHADKRCP